ncbi:MAG: S9 family peptidase [Proteobacteria bacterium]|nr:MAG: S9 family peptidase [Pseudomonadota bacterium]
MSLDAKTLKLLTAKDQYFDLAWIDAESFCYLSPAANGLRLFRQRGDHSEAIAEGLGSSLAYAGQLYSSSHVLSREGTLQSITGGEKRVLPGPSSDLRMLSGKTYVVSEVEGRDHIFVLDEDGWRSVYESPSYIRHLCLHPNGHELLFLKWPRGTLPWFAAELFVLDIPTGRVNNLHPPELNSPCGEAEFSPCGEYLACSFLTDEFFQLWLYKFKTQNWVQLTFDAREHSTPLRRSSRRTFTFIRGGLLAYTSSEKSFWRLGTLDYLGHGHTIKSPHTFIQSPRANPVTGGLAYLGGGLNYPYGPARLDLKHGRFASHPIHSLLPADKNLCVERISWSSVSGETIHGILYRDGSLTQPQPLIMPIHGGPTDAVQATWPSKALAFVKQGYSVFYVNYRGSFGYGMSYLQKLQGAFGQLEINDLIRGVKSLEGSGWIDSSRVGLWGGGVASHTVLRALSLHPEVFAAGIAVFPILDLQKHLSLCPVIERDELLWALGTSDPQLLAELSAGSALTKLSRPLGLFAGAEDPIVSAEELNALAFRLKERKVTSWLTIYENEGRVFRHSETYSDYYSKVAGFFDRFLKYRS